MSRQMRCSEDAVGMAHPDDSTLLAYNGQQLPAKEWSSVQQHLPLCETCQQRCAELKHTTDLLTGTLAHFQRTHYYPPLAMNVLERIQNPTAARLVRQQCQQERLREDLALGYALLRYAIGGMKAATMSLLALLPSWLKPHQKEPRNATMNSIPVASIPIVGFLMVLAAFVVLAYSANSNTKLHQPLGRAATTLVQPTTSIVSHQSPTPTMNPGGIPSTKPALTPAPGMSKPTIILCLAGSDKAQMRLRVCGSNFTTGTQVQLVVSIVVGSQPSPKRVVSVDAKGMFQVLWVFHDCKVAPYAVSASDVTANHTSERAKLQNIQFPNCVFPTSLPTVSGGRNKH